VADAFSAAMAKGLDLVSGKAATASSAGSGADADQASRVGGFGEGGGALYASGRSGDPWAPRGVLVAHLAEHAAPVRALTSSADGLFFVSGGDDGACKLWDCARLERDVSFRSRLTYASQGGRITALCAGVTGDDHAVASASDQGAVHVWRVEYVERKKTGAPVSDGDRGGEDAAPGGFGDSAGVDPRGGNVVVFVPQEQEQAALGGAVHGRGGDSAARRRRRRGAMFGARLPECVVLRHRARGIPWVGPPSARRARRVPGDASAAPRRRDAVCLGASFVFLARR
jgi:hypothetical protein